MAFKMKGTPMYRNYGIGERQVARKNMAPDIERNNARVDRVVARKVTNQDVASQAKSRARAKNRG